MIVYLLHFSESVFGKQHYIGCTTDLHARLLIHSSGGSWSSELCRGAFKNKVSFRLAKTWDVPNGFDFEKKLKKEGHASRHCKFCVEVAGLVPPKAG